MCCISIALNCWPFSWSPNTFKAIISSSSLKHEAMSAYAKFLWLMALVHQFLLLNNATSYKYNSAPIHCWLHSTYFILPFTYNFVHIFSHIFYKPNISTIYYSLKRYIFLHVMSFITLRFPGHIFTALPKMLLPTQSQRIIQRWRENFLCKSHCI